MSARVCGRCRRPLPAPSEGGAPAPCPFCAAQDPGRAAQSRPAGDAGAPKKRAEAFASALSENVGRTTPVHSFAVPPEAIPVVQRRKREAPPAPTPPPVVLTPPPAPVVTILPPAAAPAREPPPAPPPRRAAAVTATLASLGPGPFTAQSRPGPAAPVIVASQASPAVVAASAAVGVAAAPGYAPAVAPAPAAAPHLVPVPTPSPAPIATAPGSAPAAKAISAGSLVATMLAFSPELPESRRAPEPREATPPPMSEAPRAAPAPATRGADAWNIDSYLDGSQAPQAPSAAPEPPAAFAPRAGAAPEPQPSFDLPVDVQIRGGLSTFLHRLPTRGIGLAAAAALAVLAISAGAFLLLGGSHGSTGTAASVTPPAKGATPPVAPRVAAAPAAPVRLPSMIMPPIADPPAAAPAPHVPQATKVAAKIERAEKPAKLRDPEPDIAPPAVEAEAPHASPSRRHAHAEPKAKAVAKHAARHASVSPKRGAAHHRTVARAADAERSSASAAPADDSDKMARAREAYREGNERLFHGDAAGAITSYEEMIRLNPKDPGGYRGMGLASAQLGKRTEAVRYLRAYLKHAPNADDRGIIISRISLLQTLPQQ